MSVDIEKKPVSLASGLLLYKLTVDAEPSTVVHVTLFVPSTFFGFIVSKENTVVEFSGLYNKSISTTPSGIS